MTIENKIGFKPARMLTTLKMEEIAMHGGKHARIMAKYGEKLSWYKAIPGNNINNDYINLHYNGSNISII